MRVSVAELDTMSEARAAELLRACCGSSRWVSAMVTRRPFGSRDVLLGAAENFWLMLEPAEWREAFAHHPRIGQQQSAGPSSAQGQRWSRDEQGGLEGAGDAVRRALAEVNREYEARFGYVYLVCATGKSGAELLALARERLGHDPERELVVAAREQQKIMRLRLEKLLAA
jgi:2-oxo-4-hydroxy-4-carboxy-5-ureidoimidazoline decarboxylase